MDKFVGSSEKNLREIFDNLPDIYEEIRKREDGDAIANAVRSFFLGDRCEVILSLSCFPSLHRLYT